MLSVNTGLAESSQTHRPTHMQVQVQPSMNRRYHDDTHRPTHMQVQVQVPGYYRMKLAELEVTALYDGYTMIDRNLLKGASEKDIQSLLARMFISDKNGIQTAVNAYLINTGNHLVLIDTGTAQCFGPTLGNIVANIEAAGYRPEQIDTVLLTHLHPDHACGLLKYDGSMAFPNAMLKVAQAEAEYWLSEATATQAPAEAQGVFKMARDAVAPYIAANRYSTYGSEETLLPGMKTIASHGHTPGHVSYLFESQEGSLLVWGDIVHNHAVQLPYPDVSIEYDSDQPQAIATRKRLLADAAESKLWIAGAHLPFPGLGHIHKEAEGYRWVPLEYAPVTD
ncbi:MAG: MBL fold metallo-hydrolase [Xanthomonadaceae bacterium]|nr:MBL fold metallo-hydrolase [Xanthomonadaceae bacterium]